MVKYLYNYIKYIIISLYQGTYYIWLIISIALNDIMLHYIYSIIQL